MNIGFDLDKIFINHPPFIPDWILNKLYKERDNGILLYRIPGKIEQRFRQFSHLTPFRPPIKKNIAFLQALMQQENNNLYLISSRFGFLKKQTEKIAQKYQFAHIFKKVYFNYHNEQPHQFKDRIMKELKIDRYIDDDLSLVKYLAKQNPNILFYWLNSATDKKLTDNIFAVTDIAALTK